MSISHVLAVVPVTDFDSALAWYERLLGRPADNLPMGGLADWHVSETGWIQVFRDIDRAGKAMVNLAVDDMDEHLADLAGQGLSPAAIETATENVRLAVITDPDGNTLTLVENLRVDR